MSEQTVEASTRAEARRRRSLTGTVVRNGAANLAVPISAILTGPLLARTLGPVDRGAYAAITTPLLLAVLLGTFGAPQAVAYMAARRLAPLRQIYRCGVVLGVLSGAVSTAVLLLLTPTLLRHTPQYIPLMRGLCLGVVTFSMVAGGVRALAGGLGRFDLANAERWFGVLTRVPLLFVLAIVGAMSVGSATWVTNATALAAMLVLWRCLREPYPDVPRAPRLLRRMLSFGLQSWVGTVASVLVLRLDQTILAPLVGAAELGFYAVAVSLAEVPSTLQIAVRDVIFTAATTRQDPHLVARTSRVIVAGSLITAAIGSALAPIVLPLVFGHDFTPSVRMAQVLFGAGILGGVASILGAGLLSLGRPTARSLGQIAGLVVNVAMLALLVPPLGAIGAAWATVGAYAVMAIVAVWQFRRLAGIPVRECLVPTPDDLRFVWQLPRRVRARRG